MKKIISIYNYFKIFFMRKNNMPVFEELNELPSLGSLEGNIIHSLGELNR